MNQSENERKRKSQCLNDVADDRATRLRVNGSELEKTEQTELLELKDKVNARHVRLELKRSAERLRRRRNLALLEELQQTATDLTQKNEGLKAANDQLKSQIAQLRNLENQRSNNYVDSIQRLLGPQVAAGRCPPSSVLRNLSNDTTKGNCLLPLHADGPRDVSGEMLLASTYVSPENAFRSPLFVNDQLISFPNFPELSRVAPTMQVPVIGTGMLPRRVTFPREHVLPPAQPAASLAAAYQSSQGREELRSRVLSAASSQACVSEGKDLREVSGQDLTQENSEKKQENVLHECPSRQKALPVIDETLALIDGTRTRPL